MVVLEALLMNLEHRMGNEPRLTANLGFCEISTILVEFGFFWIWRVVRNPDSNSFPLRVEFERLNLIIELFEVSNSMYYSIRVE